jgi:hypothetical protein
MSKADAKSGPLQISAIQSALLRFPLDPLLASSPATAPMYAFGT